jgi:predicted acetyltransferase
MNLILIKATPAYQRQITDMLDEWTQTGERIIPTAIANCDHRDFERYCQFLDNRAHRVEPDKVPATIYFTFDIDRDIVVGAVDIRHYLNDNLLHHGGHIGDGVRPSERRKGYATAQIRLALQKCKELGIDKVLMTCLKDNMGSAKSIMNNGGVFENEVEAEGKIFQRYWIENNNPKE